MTSITFGDGAHDAAVATLHVFAILTGVHLPHPEGLNALAATYLANNPEA